MHVDFSFVSEISEAFIMCLVGPCHIFRDESSRECTEVPGRAIDMLLNPYAVGG